MTAPSGIDQSWGYADPAAAAAAGVRVVAMYLSHDPSKNMTPAHVKAYHAKGIGVLGNWESDPGRPLLGASAGRPDGTAAADQYDQIITGVGYRPKNTLAIAFSCDRDVNASQWPTIDGYYDATKAALAARYQNGAYGEFDLIEHLHAAGLTQAEWQTCGWSDGRLSAEADFYQYRINSRLGGASVDLDVVEHAAQLGAWWPPGHPLDIPAVTPKPTPAPVVKDEFDMADLTDLTNIVDKAVAGLSTSHGPGYVRFVNAGKANNEAAVYKVLDAGQLRYLDPVNYAWEGRPPVTEVDNRSIYFTFPVMPGTPDYRGRS